MNGLDYTSRTGRSVGRSKIADGTRKWPTRWSDGSRRSERVCVNNFSAVFAIQIGAHATLPPLPSRYDAGATVRCFFCPFSRSPFSFLFQKHARVFTDSSQRSVPAPVFPGLILNCAASFFPPRPSSPPPSAKSVLLRQTFAREHTPRNTRIRRG